jgi:hypothetical protein
MNMKPVAHTKNLERVLAQADTLEGRARFASEVRRHGVPLYRSVPDEPGVFIEKLPDGSERRGRFVSRRFMPFTS